MSPLAPLHWMYYGNSVRTWLIAATVLVGVVAALTLLRRLIVHRYRDRALATRTRVDDALVDLVTRTRLLFILFVALSIASRVLVIPPELDKRLAQVAVAALMLQIGLWAVSLVRYWGRRYLEEGRQTDPGSVTAVAWLTYGAMTIVWLVVALAVLSNFGINVTALVAGLGVGGIAIALAVQSILGDMLGAMSIVLTKPFVVGEAVTLGDLTGTVESVGLRATRLRSVNGEQLTVPNKQILENTIRNWSRMTERRVLGTIGVEYETPRDALAGVPDVLRAAVESRGDALRFDRAHLKGFGAYSVDFELVYWVRSPDYAELVVQQQAVNLEILRRFAEAGVGFAYPTTRELMVEGPPLAARAPSGSR